MQSDTQERQHTIIGKLMRLLRDHKRVIDRYLDSTKLHKSQHRLIMVLSFAEKSMSQRDLAEKLNVTPAAIAVTLKKLAKDGIIQKKISEDDMRFNEVEITEKGRQIAKESESVFRYIDARLFEDFSKEELLQFESYLDRIQTNVSNICKEERGVKS